MHRVLKAGYYGFDVVQLLVERGADVNAQDEGHESPLHLASYFLELKSVQMLLDHGANVDVVDNLGRTPLHRVSEILYSLDKVRFGVAQLLLERGADVNSPDKDNETPLHLASRIVSLEVAWILLKHGADINVKNKHGNILFQLVREHIKEEVNRLPSEDSIGAEGVALMGLLYSH